MTEATTPSLDVLEPVLVEVRAARRGFAQLLATLPTAGGIPRDVWVRYLSMQYHLTRGVQRHFFACAAHHDVAARRALRRFLLDFGIEEEPHFAIAHDDLARLGERPLPACPDVRLWWAYFDTVVDSRPFVRLGATCVLESISGDANELVRELLRRSPYLDRGNTRFVVLHQHEAVPHGDQVLEALAGAAPTAAEVADLVEGARMGALLYLRMARHAITGHPS